MASRKINKNMMQEIETVLLEADFEKGDIQNGIEFVPDFGGKLIIYNTGTLMVQGKKEQQERILEFWEGNLSHTEVSNAKQEVKNNTYFSYNVSRKKLETLKSDIESRVNELGLNMVKTTEENAHYRFSITDKNGDKVTITQYKTLKLLMQGLQSDLWNILTSLVGEKLNVSFQTIVAQVVAKPGQKVDIQTIVTKQDLEEATQKIKDRMGDCYNFLYDHDRDLIESSQYLLDINVEPKDCFGLVSGTVRSLEGFIKKLMIDIGAFTETEITARGQWDFGKVLDPKTKKLTSEVAAVLSKDPKIRVSQERVLTLLVKNMFSRRNPLFHDNPPPITTVNTVVDARSIHDELLGLMKNAFISFEKEIRV